MYADDTVLFFADKDNSVIQSVLTVELERLNVWLIENKLFLNKEKTESVLFGTSANLSNVTNYQLSISEHPLKQVTEYRYLGVILNANLSWNAHIESIPVKVGKRIGILRRLHRNITMNAAETVFKSFIRPLMEYCDSVCTCCGEQNKERFEKLQRRAARTITRFVRSDDAMNSLRWDTLETRRDMHVFKLVNKCITGNLPNFLTIILFLIVTFYLVQQDNQTNFTYRK